MNAHDSPTEASDDKLAASKPFVVGIGASAGGLEALEKLFKHRATYSQTVLDSTFNNNQRGG